MYFQNKSSQEEIVFSRNSLLVFISIMITFLALFAMSDIPSDPKIRVSSLCLGGILILICVSDFSALIIPNILNATLLITGLISSIFIFDHPALFIFGSAALWMLGFWLFSVIARFFLKKEALGMGDIKMMAGIGAWFGFLQPVSIILIASWLGLFIQFCLILFARYKNTDMQPEIPFGFYLGLGTWFVWLFGPVAAWSIL